MASTQQPPRLAGRVALITGAAGDVGSASAAPTRARARRGACVPGFEVSGIIEKWARVIRAGNIKPE